MRHGRAARRRGWAFGEVVVAVSLAVTLVGVGTQEIARQRSELVAVSEAARARATLLASYERLRVGLLDAPATGEVVALEAVEGLEALRVELVGLEAPAAGVRAVQVRVRWTSRLDGGARERALTTLVAGGDA